ncbi:MAG: flagellar basal-body rod protein FlgG, partial [Thermodesulfobacteriota bacterium]|nr:flagellar basal-body rod protein FlgG [Thermodesulfobacteriota bacterium]
MIRALWTAATGMEAQQLNIDVIANNLANVNTVGFKRSRADFQDLLYQTLKMAGAASTGSGNQVPTGIQIGHGSKPVAVQKIFLQGDYQQTQNELDLVIEGQGFFQILMPTGDDAYTRAGSFKLDMDGRVVTSDGYVLQPEITVPQDSIKISIGNDGIVSVQNAGETELSEIGGIELAKFTNPGGLVSMGKNLYMSSESSGYAIT